jgi:hypothetical protein
VEIRLPIDQLWPMVKRLGETFAQKDDMDGVRYLRVIDEYRTSGDVAVIRMKLSDQEIDELCVLFMKRNPDDVSIKDNFLCFRLHLRLDETVWILMDRIEQEFHLGPLDVNRLATHPSTIECYGNQNDSSLFINVLVSMARQREFEQFLQAFCVTHRLEYADHRQQPEPAQQAVGT